MARKGLTMHSLLEWKLCKRRNGSEFLKLMYYQNEAGGYIEAGRFNMSSSELVNNDWSIKEIFTEIEIMSDIDMKNKVDKQKEVIDNLFSKINKQYSVIDKMAEYINGFDVHSIDISKKLWDCDTKKDRIECIINYFK